MPFEQWMAKQEPYRDWTKAFKGMPTSAFALKKPVLCLERL